MSNLSRKMLECDRAVESLKDARDALRDAGAFRAAAAVRRALSSAEGARRNATAQWSREARAQKEGGL